jgi:hypothetical protein
MENETGALTPSLHSLIPLGDFKAVLGIDDREDPLSRYCLVTAAYTIEQYCRRRLYLKKHVETLTDTGDPLLPLGEFPVREIEAISREQITTGEAELLEPGLYRVVPALEGETGEAPEDRVYSLALLKQGRGLTVIRAVYWAGYGPGEAPPDLASACLELAAWNMTRYRGRRIGMTGNVRGSGKEGEHLETSMPENVRELLEPYRRRTI